MLTISTKTRTPLSTQKGNRCERHAENADIHAHFLASTLSMSASWMMTSMYLLSGATMTSFFLERNRMSWSSLLLSISCSTVLALIASGWKRAAYWTASSRDASVKLWRMAMPSLLMIKNPRTPQWEVMRFTNSSISGPEPAAAMFCCCSCSLGMPT
ncbi:dynein light chain 2b, cytoplasmic, putative [Leishmania tarentolae]|uniref:Dynein light chain 2b, cytoplasmic, putative n=1 Tax=Leishmania tarentolae TaxID=5689 RepID=A0A640KEE2_LEITA|nr:dynein light chain 2b, cytoplasmic, putative [Leishmania tarentolae]